MASDPFLVGVFFGFVPAMGFLYILLNNYQAFFDEKRVFKTFFFGLVLGLLATVFESMVGLSDALNASNPLWLTAFFAVLFGALEAAAAAAALNWKTFRGRKDTPYYGAALGLGFGAVNALFIIGSLVNSLTTGVSGPVEIFLVTMIGVYFIGSILIHAVAFVWIAQGTSSGGLPGQVVRATSLLAMYIIVFFLIARWPGPLTNIVPVIALAVAIAFTWQMLRVLDGIVPEEVQREAGVHRRRLARKRLRESGNQRGR